MNKLVKGSIAGAAGIALLLGGAGTFALWNDSVTLANQSVSTGELDIELGAAAATWTDISTKTSGTPAVTTSSVIGTTTFNPTNHKLVPGDTVTYSKSVTIKASGKNIAAKLAYVPGSVVIDPALAPFVTVTVDQPVFATPDGWTSVADGTGWRIIPGASTTTSTQTFNVVLTVKFLDTASAQVGQNMVGVSLNGAAFSLTQVRN